MDITDPIRGYDESMQIRVEEVRLEDEPALWFQREWFGKKAAYVLPLSSAYAVGDEITLMECAVKMGTQLELLTGVYGSDKSTLHKLMDMLTKHVDDLVQKIPPAPARTRADFEREVEARGIQSMKIDGQELLH